MPPDIDLQVQGPDAAGAAADPLDRLLAEAAEKTTLPALRAWLLALRESDKEGAEK